MDSLTQIVLGGATAAAVGGKTFGRKTLWLGALLGTLPDLDSFIPYASAIDNVTRHRGFSHSLFVLSLLSVAIWWLLIRLKPHLKDHAHTLWWSISLPLLTHPLLDAFTTYGTQLFWPLRTPPVAWSSLFIIDPLYTLPLLIACVVYYAHCSRLRVVYIGLVLSTGYLLWSVAAQQWVSARSMAHLPAQEGQPISTLVTPLPFNTLYWRVLLVYPEHYREATLKAWGRGAIEWRDPVPTHPEMIQYVAANDWQRMRWFTQDRLALKPSEDELILVDLRLGTTNFFPFQFKVAERTAGQWQSLAGGERVLVERPAISGLGALTAQAQ